MLKSPKAGSGAGRDEIPRLVSLLAEASIECQVIVSVDELRAQLTTQAPTGETVVVAAGGDGTLSLAASTISSLGRPRDAAPPLVPMPLGTENLLARQFGFTNSAEAVRETIRRGSVRSIDAGLANGKLFLIMATSGFDAEVVRRLHLTRRGHIRRFSYLLPILYALKRYSFPTIRIHVDGGEPIECAWSMVFNLPQYGGNLLIEPGALDDDGLFDVIAFRDASVISGVRYVMEILLGWHLKNASVVRARGRAILIESDTKVPYQLDGDYAGKLPLRIEMLPRAVRLLMPITD